MRTSHNLSLRLCFALVWLSVVPRSFTQNDTQPPPMEPLADVDHPTQQTPSLESLLAFLPDTLASYKGGEIAKATLIRDMGMGIRMHVGYGRKFSQEDLQKIVAELVDVMANRVVMLGLAAQNGFTPDLKDGQKEVEQLRKRHGPAQFQGLLKMQMTTEEKLVQMLSEKHALDRWWKEKVMADIAVTDEEIVDYYGANSAKFRRPDQVNLQHIMLQVPPDALPQSKVELKARIGSVHARIRQGEDFATLAKQHSNGPAATGGGELGWVDRGRMVPALDKVAFSLPIGTLSEIIESKLGYHIVRVKERRDAAVQPLNDELKQTVLQLIRQPRAEEFVNKASEQWRETHAYKRHF